jgi:hypothetical protein
VGAVKGGRSLAQRTLDGGTPLGIVPHNGAFPRFELSRCGHAETNPSELASIFGSRLIVFHARFWSGFGVGFQLGIAMAEGPGI